MTPYYQDDAVTIYHGDCREIVPTLGRFDLLLTDPPYGIERFNRPDGGNSQRIRSFGHSDTPWNNEPPARDALEMLMKCCRLHVIFGMNNLPLPTTEHFLVWDKEQTVANFASAELAWCNLPTPAKVFRFGIHRHNHSKGGGHPTEKPLALMAWCIGLAGEGAQTILDPYAGVCTVGRAAKDLGRRCVCIEREEAYAEIGARRMSQGVLDFGPPSGR